MGFSPRRWDFLSHSPAPPSPGMPRGRSQLRTAGSQGAQPLPWPGCQAVVQPRDRVASGQEAVTARRKARASSGAQLPQGPGRMSPFSHTGLARAGPTRPSSSREGPTAARLCGDTGQGHRAVPAVSPRPQLQGVAAHRGLPAQCPSDS